MNFIWFIDKLLKKILINISFDIWNIYKIFFDGFLIVNILIVFLVYVIFLYKIF